MTGLTWNVDLCSEPCSVIIIWRSLIANQPKLSSLLPSLDLTCRRILTPFELGSAAATHLITLAIQTGLYANQNDERNVNTGSYVQVPQGCSGS